MSGDVQVRICEHLGVRFPRVTRLVLIVKHTRADAQSVIRQADSDSKNPRSSANESRERSVSPGKEKGRSSAGAKSTIKQADDYLKKRILNREFNGDYFLNVFKK